MLLSTRMSLEALMIAGSGNGDNHEWRDDSPLASLQNIELVLDAVKATPHASRSEDEIHIRDS